MLSIKALRCRLEANASRYHGKPPDELDWSDRQRQRRAVAEYLAALDETIEPNPDRKVLQGDLAL